MQIRKNQGIGQEQDQGSVGIDVVHPLDVRTAPAKDLSGLFTALGQLQGIAQKQKAIKDEKMSSQGQRDAHLGKVDEALIEDSKAYAEGAAAINDTTAGLRWINQARTDLERAAQEDGFDFDKWSQGQKQFFAEASAAGVSKFGVQRINGFMAQFDQQMGAMHATISAKANLKRSTNALAENFDEFRSQGLTAPEQLRKYDATLGERSGLFPEEREAIYANGLVNSIAQAKTIKEFEEAKALANDYGIAGKPEWSEAFTKQSDHTEKRLATEELNARKANIEERLRVDTELTSLARQRKLTIPYLTKRVESKEILQSEAVSAWNTQQAELERLRLKAASDYEAAQKKVKDRAALNAVLQNGGAQMSYGSGVKMSDLQDELDTQLFESFQRIRENPETGTAEVRANLELARRNGMMPRAIKGQFSTIDPSSPKSYMPTAQLYQQLKADGMGRYIENHIDRGALAQLDRIDQLSKAVPLEQAVEMAAQSVVSAEDADKRMNFNFKTVESGFQSIASNLTVPGPARNVYQALVKANLMAGRSEQDAVASATEQWQRQYTVMNGVALPKGAVSEEFESSAENYMDEVLMPTLRKQLGDQAPEKAVMMPVPNAPGTFMVLPESGSADVLRVNGKPLIINEQAMIDDVSKRRASVVKEQATALKFYPHDFVTTGNWTKEASALEWWKALPKEEQQRMLQEDAGG